MPSPVGSQVISIDSRPTCARPSCGKVSLSAKCGHKMCSACCRLQPDTCGFAAHDKARSALNTAMQSTPSGDNPANPFAMTRPRHIHPPSTPMLDLPGDAGVSAPSPASAPPPELRQATARTLSVAMDPSWIADWDAAAARLQEKRLGEATQRENKRRIAHSVEVYYYREVRLAHSSVSALNAHIYYLSNRTAKRLNATPSKGSSHSRRSVSLKFHISFESLTSAPMTSSSSSPPAVAAGRNKM